MDICSICLLETNNNYYESLCCNNKFHFECLEKWFKIGNTCPLCREKYLHMDRYSSDMEDYLERIGNIDKDYIKKYIENITENIVIYKYQVEEYNIPRVVKLLEKIEGFLNVIQEFYNQP